MLRDILQLPPPALRDFDGKTPLDLVDVIKGSARTPEHARYHEHFEGWKRSSVFCCIREIHIKLLT